MSNMYQMMCRSGALVTPIKQPKVKHQRHYHANNFENDEVECNSRGIVKSPESSSRKSDASAEEPTSLHQMTISFPKKAQTKTASGTPPSSTLPPMHTESHMEGNAGVVKDVGFRSDSTSYSFRDRDARSLVPQDAYSLTSDPALALGIDKTSAQRHKASLKSINSAGSGGDTESNTSSDYNSSLDQRRGSSPTSSLFAPSPPPSVDKKIPLYSYQSSLELPLTRLVNDTDSDDDDTILATENPFEDTFSYSEVSPEFDNCFRNTNLLDQDAMTILSAALEEASECGDGTVVDDEAFSGELWSTMMKPLDKSTLSRHHRGSYNKYRSLLLAPTQKCHTFQQRRGSFGDESVGPPPKMRNVKEEDVKTLEGARYVPVERTTSHRHNQADSAVPHRRPSRKAKSMAEMYDEVDQRVQQLLESDSTRLVKLQEQLAILKSKAKGNALLPNASPIDVKPPMTMQPVKQQDKEQTAHWSPDKNTLYYGHDDENDGFGYF